MSRSARAVGAAFSPLTMVIVLVVGVTAFLGIALLSAYQPELRSGNDGGGHALSRGAIGFGALPVLLRETGVPVVLSRGVLNIAADDSLLVLTPSPGTSPDALEAVEHDGATLIVLPKWATIEAREHRGWVTTVGTLPTNTSLDVLPEALREGTTLTQAAGTTDLALRRPDGTAFGAAVRVENLRTLSGDAWIPVVVDAGNRPVVAMHSVTRDYVLADADLLSTHGLKSLDGARTAVAILDIVRAEGAPVIFDLTLHGFQRTRSLLRLMLEPPLLGLTLVLLAMTAFAAFQAAVRFGPPRETGRVVALGKQALADNTAGLIRLARREHHMALPYALLMRAAAARAIGAPRHLSDAEMDAFLDRVGRTTGATTPFSALAQSARAACTPGDLLKVARDLHRWNQELTRARQ